MKTTLQPPSESMPGNRVPVAESMRALLAGLIDYAGLFPPASLGMAAAVSNYESYLRSEYNWMLGRFIVPVARLKELEEAVALLPPAQAEPQWSVSALPGADLAADLERIRDFNGRLAASASGHRAGIESIELKIASAAEIDALSPLIPEQFETYFEIPWDGGAPGTASSEMSDAIAAAARCGRRAKIRTGGETADKFPPPERVVEFIRLCGASGVAFKATAGLHHPLRASQRLTYRADSPCAVMHGFLNVFLASAFLHAGMDARLSVALVGEPSPAAFHFDSQGIVWRGHRLGLAEISAARRSLAISFGSCSFTEPVDDLRALNLL